MNARCWWLAGAFGLLLLFTGRLCDAQSPSPPPRPSSPPPSPRSPPPPSPATPYQTVPLSLVDLVTKASLCSRVQESGCLGELEWLIDLDPYPLTSGTAGSRTAGLTCIGGNGTGCLWSTAKDYIAYTGRDTFVYIPVGLSIRAQNITRIFQFGHAFYAGALLRQLRTLSITCADPVPVFAPYALEPLVMAFAAAGMDYGVTSAGAAGASAPPPPPPPSATAASAPPSNTSSDAAYNATTLVLAYSRLYTQPTLGSPLLRSLSVQDCALTGQLPPANFWLQLPALERLDLSRNQLSGPLPATFGPSPPLSHVNLSHNRISGPLTASLVRYGGCGRTLDLSYNNLRGSLPDAWLASACSLYGKSSIGLAAATSLWRRRRLIGEVAADGEREDEPRESGPDGGVAKVSSSSYLSYRAAKSTATAVTESTAPASNSATGGSSASATTSDSYPFWLSYPMSYMYGGDGCPMLGVAWNEEVAAHVRNGSSSTTAQYGGGGAEPTPLDFTVLLYGNPHLDTPGASRTGYATAATRYLRFSVRENACTIFEPLMDLLFVWGSFGGAALTVLLAALLHALLALRRSRQRVAPLSGSGGAADGHHRQGSRTGARRRVREAAVAAAKPAGGANLPSAAPAAGWIEPAVASVTAAAAQKGPGDSGGERLPASSAAAALGGGGAAAAAVPQEGRATAGAANAASGGGGGAEDGGGSGGGGNIGSSSGGGKARLIIVAHSARAYSARAVRRLSVYGNAVADGLEAVGVWLVYGIPWGPLARALVAAAVHLAAGGLTYAMSLPQRTEYCKNVRQCGSYLYVVPAVLSALSIGVTVFLMRATRELAGSMASKVTAVGGKPSVDGGVAPLGASAAPVLPFAPVEGSSDGHAGAAAGAGAKEVDAKAGVAAGDCDGGSGSGGSSGCSRTGSGESGDGTEAQPTPPLPLPPVASGEAWVSGLQPRRTVQSGGTYSSPPGSAEPFPPPPPQLAALAAVAGSLPLYDAEALPVPARLGGGPSRSSTTTSPRASPPSAARSCQSSPRASSRFGANGGGAAAGVGSCGGSPIRPSLGPPNGDATGAAATAPLGSSYDDDGSPRSGIRGGSGGGGGGGAGVFGASGGGPVAEALEPGGDDCLGTAVAEEVAVTPGRERTGRGGLFAWLHGKPAAAAAGPLLPASPYGDLHDNAKSGQRRSGYEVRVAATAATRTRASLESSFRSPGPGPKNGGHPESGSPLGHGGAAEVEAPAPTGANSSSPGAPAAVPGPVAEAANDGDDAPEAEADRSRARSANANAFALGASSRTLKPPPPLLPLGPEVYGSLDRASAVAYGATADGGLYSISSFNPASSGPSATVVNPELSGGVSGAGDGAAPKDDPGRAAPRKPSRREELRPNPVMTNLRGGAGLGSPGTPGGGGGTDSPMPYSTVEPVRPLGRSLVNSTSRSTHGSVRSRIAVSGDATGGPGAAGGWLGSAAPQAAAAAAAPPQTDPRPVDGPSSSPPLPLDSPAPTGPSKRGGPWLEDRLAALAALSANGATAAPPSGTVAPRTASVAAAAAVAKAAPRSRAAGGAGAGVPAAVAGVQKLQPEALRVVNQYLRDYATGKKGSGLGARGGRTAASVAVVVLVFAPLAPLAAALAVVTALIIVLHAAAGGSAAAAAATRRCYRRLRRQPAPPPDGSAAAGGGASRFDRLAASLRLSGKLLLALHLHVAGWLMCVPLAVFAGVMYGMGYVWGKDAVPLPWVFLAANCACLGGALLLLIETVTGMPAWEHGVCRYPYAVVLQVAAAAAAANRD